MKQIFRILFQADENVSIIFTDFMYDLTERYSVSRVYRPVPSCHWIGVQEGRIDGWITAVIIRSSLRLYSPTNDLNVNDSIYLGIPWRSRSWTMWLDNWASWLVLVALPLSTSRWLCVLHYLVLSSVIKAQSNNLKVPEGRRGRFKNGMQSSVAKAARSRCRRCVER